MPKRQRLVTVDTPIQGDDAWIQIRKVSWRDGVRLQTLYHHVNALKDGFQSPDALEDLVEVAEILIKYLVDWNWVDDDDEPLPKPGEIDDLLDYLAAEEVNEISRLVRRPIEQQGNSEDDSESSS